MASDQKINFSPSVFRSVSRLQDYRVALLPWSASDAVNSRRDAGAAILRLFVSGLGRFVLLALAPMLALSAAPANGSEAKDALVEFRPTLTEYAAVNLLESAREEAETRRVEVSIAVVDRNGQLLSFLRIGKAGPVTIENAIAKANTAAQLGIPSKALEDMVDEGKTSYLAIKGVVPLQGGVPVIVDGEVVGGIGCSGASADVDEEIATAAVRALQAQN